MSGSAAGPEGQDLGDRSEDWFSILLHLTLDVKLMIEYARFSLILSAIFTYNVKIYIYFNFESVITIIVMRFRDLRKWEILFKNYFIVIDGLILV